MLAKVDVEHAYHNILMHADNRPILGMRWRDKIYVNTVLPFGLRSAPKVFSAVADTLEWILPDIGTPPLPGRFLTMGRANIQECVCNLMLIEKICKYLGIPLKIEKIEGTSAALVFLGIMLDTNKREISLPEQKLEDLKALVSVWKSKSSCTKRDLLSLIGKLANHWGCGAIWSTRWIQCPWQSVWRVRSGVCGGPTSRCKFYVIMQSD